jgi:DNA-binding transcriptional MerR regulator
MLLSQKEIIERLKEEGISMGRNPARTLAHWREIGLIPKPIITRRGGKVGTISRYPEEVVELIADIRGYQKAGLTLETIAYAFGKEEEFKAKMKNLEDGRKMLCRLVDELVDAQQKAVGSGTAKQETAFKDLSTFCVTISETIHNYTDDRKEAQLAEAEK